MGFRKRRGRTYSKAVRRQGVMNQTEKWYYDTVLKPRLASGDLLKAEFETVQLILVHPDKETGRRSSTYLPDFYCVNKDGETEIIEIKGPPPDAADRLKIKMASEQKPEWHFKMVQVGSKRIRKEESF